jgi:hypothetical protein
VAFLSAAERVGLSQDWRPSTGCREDASTPHPLGPQQGILAQELEADFHLHRQAAILIHVDLLLHVVTSH